MRLSSAAALADDPCRRIRASQRFNSSTAARRALQHSLSDRLEWSWQASALDDASWVAPAAGIVLSFAWWRLLVSYRDLNGAKFGAIDILERRLPATPFADEWAALRPAGDAPAARRRRYAELGTIERVVPTAFAALCIAIPLGA